MKPKPYTKTEIDLMHIPIQDKLDKILVQTIKTNGRLGKLEVWKGYITGGLTILTLLVVPIAIVIVTGMYSASSIEDKISDALQQELNKYEIVIE